MVLAPPQQYEQTFYPQRPPRIGWLRILLIGLGLSGAAAVGVSAATTSPSPTSSSVAAPTVEQIVAGRARAWFAAAQAPDPRAMWDLDGGAHIYPSAEVWAVAQAAQGPGPWRDATIDRVELVSPYKARVYSIIRYHDDPSRYVQRWMLEADGVWRADDPPQDLR
jgi:hypothetical protein